MVDAGIYLEEDTGAGMWRDGLPFLGRVLLPQCLFLLSVLLVLECKLFPSASFVSWASTALFLNRSCWLALQPQTVQYSGTLCQRCSFAAATVIIAAILVVVVVVVAVTVAAAVLLSSFILVLGYWYSSLWDVFEELLWRGPPQKGYYTKGGCSAFSDRLLVRSSLVLLPCWICLILLCLFLVQ